MAQVAKVESQVSIKSSADKFFRAYCDQKMWPTICPNIVKKAEFLKGESAMSAGSLTKWTYAPIGNSTPEVGTVLTEAIDENNKSTTCRVIDGNAMKLYNLYKVTVQVTNSPDGNGSSVKATVEYEKRDADVPEPTMYLESAKIIFKTIDAYLVGNP